MRAIRPVRWWFIAFILLAALAGCATAPEITGTPTATRRSTRTRPPTYTPRPSKTSDPTLTAAAATRQTDWELHEIAEFSTQVAQSTLVASFPGNCGYHQYFGNLISPDGNWLATICYHPRGFFVLNLSGTTRWEIPFSWVPYDDPDYDGEDFCDVFPIHWSNDSRYIYFKLYRCFDLDVDYVPDYRSDMSPRPDPLYQLDNQTGLWHQLTPRINYYSFSPTGRRLAYFIRYGRGDDDAASIGMSILDLKTGERTEYSLAGYVAAANVVWSEDGRKFVFSAVKGSPGEFFIDPKSTYTLYMIDTESLKLTIIQEFPDLENPIYPVAWTDNILTIQTDYSISDYDYGFSVSFFDLDTGKFVTATPTPTPLTP